MDFYTSISKHYDYIFPYNHKQVEFVYRNNIQQEAKILEVGCGSGNLALGLLQANFTVDAIDYDINMIEIAKQKTNAITFQQMDMLDISKNYEPESFDCIVCFGNTLVHLLDNNKITSFIDSCHKLLKKGGLLAIQILNYENIVNNKISSLPLIENEEIKFERFYNFREDSLIDFITKLSIKAEDKSIDNCIQLNPIFETTLKNIFISAKFKNIETYGNFNMDKLRSNDIPLIIKGIK